MSLFRFLFILSIMIGYALLFTEQRIESREKKLEISRLMQESETLNARKQELTVLIETERNRLIQQSRNMGTPLSAKDVVNIE